MNGNFSALCEANLNKALGCWQLNLKIESWGKVEAACNSIHDCRLCFLLFCVFVMSCIFVGWAIQNCTCFIHVVLVLQCVGEDRSRILRLSSICFLSLLCSKRISRLLSVRRIVFSSENFRQLTGIPSLFFAVSVCSLGIFRIEGLNYEIHLWKMIKTSKL